MTVSLLLSCGDPQQPPANRQSGDLSDGFTFFGLGHDTSLSKAVRSELEEKLGSDAIEKRGIIDLETNYRGFLKTHFPPLESLNRQLNPPSNERVEHGIIKLMYRYTRKKDVPFKYVELVFSAYTQTPLYFSIVAKKEGAGIIDTLGQKYGAYDTIVWPDEKGESLFWTHGEDLLLVSKSTDRFGDPVYHIMIYYAANLQALIRTEQEAAKGRETEQRRAGKTAF